MEENNSGDETEVIIETSNNEVEQGHTGKPNEYDSSLDIPIALRKGTRFVLNIPFATMFPTIISLLSSELLQQALTLP